MRRIVLLLVVLMLLAIAAVMPVTADTKSCGQGECSCSSYCYYVCAGWGPPAPSCTYSCTGGCSSCHSCGGEYNADGSCDFCVDYRW
jgi:hypothetical protein